MFQKYKSEDKEKLLKDTLELLCKIKEDSIILDERMITFGMQNKSALIIKVLDDMSHRLSINMVLDMRQRA